MKKNKPKVQGKKMLVGVDNPNQGLTDKEKKALDLRKEQAMINERRFKEQSMLDIYSTSVLGAMIVDKKSRMSDLDLEEMCQEVFRISKALVKERRNSILELEEDHLTSLPLPEIK